MKMLMLLVPVLVILAGFTVSNLSDCGPTCCSYNGGSWDVTSSSCLLANSSYEGCLSTCHVGSNNPCSSMMFILALLGGTMYLSRS